MKKSSWNKLITEFKKGVAFVGSTFTLNEREIIARMNDLDEKETSFKVDRKFLTGVNSIRLSIPNTDKTSMIDRVGQVFEYSRYFLVVKDTNTVVYAKVSK